MLHRPEAAPVLFTREQVSQIVGCHPETITRASRRGELPAYYISKRMVKYRRSDVDKWLETFRYQSPPADRKRPKKLAPVAG
jgi:excisionase family DNA binding protein